MTKQYEKLDELIVGACRRNAHPLHTHDVNVEARVIAKEIGRDSSRVIDGRLQVLRKKGSIVWNSKTGWGVPK